MFTVQLTVGLFLVLQVQHIELVSIEGKCTLQNQLLFYYCCCKEMWTELGNNSHYLAELLCSRKLTFLFLPIFYSRSVRSMCRLFRGSQKTSWAYRGTNATKVSSATAEMSHAHFMVYFAATYLSTTALFLPILNIQLQFVLSNYLFIYWKYMWILCVPRWFQVKFRTYVK